MPEREHWHLNKSIGVSHIVATLSLASGLVMWGMKMEGRVEHIETAMIAAASSRSSIEARLKEADQVIKADMLALRREVREDLKNINDKLDKLLYQSGRQSGMSGM